MLTEEDISWSEQLATILKEDMTKEIIAPMQFNNSLALLLSWGYFICAIVSFLLGNWLLSYKGTEFAYENIAAGLSLLQDSFPFIMTFECVFAVSIILGIVCYIAMYFTANIIIQIILLHICAINLSPLVAVIYMYAHVFTSPSWNFVNISVSGVHLSVFWIMIIIYVLILLVLAKMQRDFFSKARYVLLTAAVYTAVMTLLAGTLAGLWIPAATCFTLFTLYIGLNWFHAYQVSEGSSRYFAVTESCRIMNLLGLAFNMWGLTRGPFVLR